VAQRFQHWHDVLIRLAAYSAFLAVPTLLLAALFLALFFRGMGERYEPLNDVFSAFGLLLLVLPAFAVYTLTKEHVGAWLGIITWAAIAGMVLAAAGQVLLVLGVINLQTSFVTGGIGIVPAILWLGALALLVLRYHQLGPVVGWLALAVIVLSVLLTLVSSARLAALTWAVSVALIVALVAWLISLGSDLLRQA